MNNIEKLEFIKWNEYAYIKKKWNATETKEFFDETFAKILYENVLNITNFQANLLSYFDFSLIFNDFDNGINNTQNYLLKFFILKDVKGLDLLLKNMPSNLKLPYLYDFYQKLQGNNKPYFLSKIITCLNKEETIKFINENINNIEEDEIYFIIRQLYINHKDDTLHELFQNEIIGNVAVNKINAPFFYEMIDDLHLPNSIIEKRERELQNILINFREYDINDVKEAFCDLYMHNTYQNTLLDIKTIIELALEDNIFKNEYLGEIYQNLYNIFTFLNNNGEYTEIDIHLLNSNQIDYQILSKCYYMGMERFKEKLSDKINQNITYNISPELLTSSQGNTVELFTIENQTEAQGHFTMLVSTIPCAENATKFKEIYYSNQNSEIINNRRSCSLINETKLSSLFGGDERITFGFKNLKGRVITSATLGDGRTDGNEEVFRKKRRVVKSYFGQIDTFIAKTQGHNEITINMGSTNEVMKPDYILITRENPTQFEIDVAKEFAIPIIKVNINKYNQIPNEPYSPEDYDYYNFKRKEITPINPVFIR